MRVTGENWLKAQHSVLGSALIDERLAPKVLTQTDEEDYSGGCRTVYLAMRRLFESGSPVDVVSVSHALGDNYSDFLVQLMEITPTGANVDHHIHICREQARLLGLRAVAAELAEADTMEAAQSAVERACVLMAAERRSDVVDMTSAMHSFMDRMQRKAEYISWPIAQFNSLLYAELGDFIIFGAEPSVGKTAFALQCAWHWAERYNVGFFSFETSSEKLFDRMMAYVGSLPMQKIKNRELSEADWDRTVDASQRIVSRRLKLVRASGFTIADIRARILECGFQIAIIDYAQLVTSRGSNRYEQVTNTSIGLHNIAQGLGVMVLALSQLSRSDDDRTPKNSDLRESGQLEQDADVIMMLHLEKKSNPNGNRKLTVTKNKEGECFQSLLSFDGQYQRFEKIDKPGQTAQKFIDGGKRILTKNRLAAQQSGQFSLLPDDDPELPFGK